MGPVLPALTIAGTIIGGAVSAYGALSSGAASSAQAQYQSQVAANNAITARAQARDAQLRGANAEAANALKTKQMLGLQEAALAANGVQVGTGSALDLTTDTSLKGASDALTIRDNAAREALGYTAQANNFQSESEASASQTGMLGSIVSAGGTILGSAGSVASKWYTYNQNGVNVIP